MLKKWNSWLMQVKHLEDVKIERCYKPGNIGHSVLYQLHCFADASTLGMGVVIYLRMSDDHGNVHCSCVMGKSRVAPLKTMTIPRMELTAATLAVKLSKLVDEQLDFPKRKYISGQTVQQYFATSLTPRLDSKPLSPIDLPSSTPIQLLINGIM
ncbi:uncharacterized protein LOC133186549 [Saccostrea echinata]|uniref:uncharacterized protein LOC133186549 n=1 Tax=Saccostrea echinata TaxID=191078 RepID=UPI002A83B5E1|nr:uncharacterized protein LOC133186549 [Saccostrea echinata]